MNDASTQKPFACKAEGCNMSFTNEDHLNVHEKRHAMVLNLELENKNPTVFAADQTPTPTRLIKNCEEVGLFDDLKHVNPFDETFRRAVESKNNADESEIDTANTNLLANSVLNNEDSLHTPQVFPVVEEGAEVFKIEKQSVILSDHIAFKTKNDQQSVSESSICKKEDRKQKRLGKNDLPNNSKKPKANADIQPRQTKLMTTATVPIIIPNSISLIQPQVITLGFLATPPTTPSKRILLPKPVDPASQTNSSSSIPIKEKLKEILSNQRNSKKPIKRITTEKSVSENRIFPKEKSNHVDDDVGLERRRAAALRYRRKIKKEQADLKRKNSDLLAENAQLKAVIKHLKQALLAHQNCGISRGNPLGMFVIDV